jgi:hypothetical protein
MTTACKQTKPIALEWRRVRLPKSAGRREWLSRCGRYLIVRYHEFDGRVVEHPRFLAEVREIDWLGRPTWQLVEQHARNRHNRSLRAAKHRCARHARATAKQARRTIA